MEEVTHFESTLGKYMQLTGGKIGDRLLAEAETNLAINVIPGLAESYEVQGRGELQLGHTLLINSQYSFFLYKYQGIMLANFFYCLYIYD